ncbi:MAG TPA: tyrosine-type recombinase/integrase [Pilimelia sp.]|nr:tyrosine-type recombinase/integrase [Pilimelia sp.]
MAGLRVCVRRRGRGAAAPPDFLTRRFHHLVGESGLPPIRLHDLRHGAASLAHCAGVDLKTVQAQLGHSSIVLTADTYTSILTDLPAYAAEATARLVLTAAARNPGHRHRGNCHSATGVCSRSRTRRPRRRRSTGSSWARR